MTHILIIDDDDTFRTMLREMLEQEGYAVAEAPDGKQGCRYCQATEVDLVMVDIVMPEKEGIETITDLIKEFPNMKIIAMSGGGSYGKLGNYLKMAEMLGAQKSLAKPFKKEELIAVVKELLNENNSVS